MDLTLEMFSLERQAQLGGEQSLALCIKKHLPKGSRLACCQSNGACGICLGSTTSTPLLSSACIRAWMRSGSAAGQDLPCLGRHSTDWTVKGHIQQLTIWKAISNTNNSVGTNIAPGRSSNNPPYPIKTIHIPPYIVFPVNLWDPNGVKPSNIIKDIIYINTTKDQNWQWDMLWGSRCGVSLSPKSLRPILF